MPTISSAGIGSGLDINALVSQLVQAERAPRENRLAREQSRLDTEFTALAMLKGVLSALQSAANGLSTPSSLTALKTLVSDEQYLTASAGGSAVPGRYDVQVEQLATAARLGSAAYDDADALVGSGTLTLTVGTAAFSIELTPGTTLRQVRDAINSAEDNTGVTATLIRDASGTYLVLSGRNTGADNTLSVSTPDGDAALQQLVADLNAFDATRDVAAQDAIVHVSGYEIHSASNSINDAIDGVTLNLKKTTEAGQSISIVVERDDAAIQKKVESFIAAFNNAAQQISSLGRYDPVTRTAGPMLGDSLLRSIDTQLRRILFAPVAGGSGDYRTLSSLGISLNATGTLQLDATKFAQALEADPAAVGRIFASESGVAVRVAEYLKDRLSSSGELSARDQLISSQRRRIEQDRQGLDARMLVIQQRYLKQFTAMDALLAQLQNTSNYLAQQLQSLSRIGRNAD
jgi:flagellar hook-associated protein 2